MDKKPTLFSRSSLVPMISAILLGATLLGGAYWLENYSNGRMDPSTHKTIPIDPAALGMGWYGQGDYTAAETEFLAAIGDHPSSLELRYDLGNAYFMDGKYQKAIEAFASAAALDPQDPDVQFNLQLARKMKAEESQPGFKGAEEARKLSGFLRELNLDHRSEWQRFWDGIRGLFRFKAK